MTELETLKLRWAAKTREPMPEHIEVLPIQFVRSAVEKTERGEAFFVPRAKPEEWRSVLREECSIADWDRQDDKNGNAYG